MANKYINTAFYLGKDLKFACGNGSQEDCSWWIVVKWWKESYLKFESCNRKGGWVWLITHRWTEGAEVFVVCVCAVHACATRFSWVQIFVFTLYFWWTKSHRSKQEIWNLVCLKCSLNTHHVSNWYGDHSPWIWVALPSLWSVSIY